MSGNRLRIIHPPTLCKQNAEVKESRRQVSGEWLGHLEQPRRTFFIVSGGFRRTVYEVLSFQCHLRLWKGFLNIRILSGFVCITCLVVWLWDNSAIGFLSWFVSLLCFFFLKLKTKTHCVNNQINIKLWVT